MACGVGFFDTEREADEDGTMVQESALNTEITTVSHKRSFAERNVITSKAFSTSTLRVRNAAENVLVKGC